MDAVIFTDTHADFPRELLARRPPALMPLAGGPAAKLMLERLARARARRVVFVSSDTPYLLERQFGHGERFGLDIRYILRRAVVGIREGLVKAAPLLDQAFLVYDRLLVTDIDPGPVLAAHREAGAMLTVCAPRPDPAADPGPAFHVLDRDAVTDIPAHIQNLSEWTATLPRHAVHTLHPAGASVAVDGLAAYHRAVLASLAGLPPFSPSPGGIALGRQCEVHPTVRLVPPVSIGDFTSIGRECVIGPMALLGKRCVVDARSEILRSVVFSDGYVGREVTLDGRVVDRNLLVSPESGTVVRVPDAFLLGDAADPGLAQAVSRLLQRLLALAALLPASLVLLPVLLIPAWRRRLVRREAAGEYTPRDLKGDKTLRRFHMHELCVANRFLRRLPALWDVAAGRLNLVGVEPLSPEEAESWRGSWADDRFLRPPGLVTPWRAMTSREPESDEKRVMENYYVQTWSFGEDMRILVKNLFMWRRA